MAETKTVALYLNHFGLREAPFKITPTTEFFYGGGQRGEILHALQYAISVGEGIMSVTGEVGSGKTMLLRTLIEKLPDNTDIIYIANPSLSGREILYNICEELGLQASDTRPDTVRMLQEYLVAQHVKGRRVIAFIDEAQAMPDESLEEIRLLSNLETSRDKLLQIILFGQPEFEEKLRQQNMRQLRERITVALTLKPFGRDDVREYINTRLRAAGYNGAQMFTNDACRLIAIVSQGLSRRINVLADKALLAAYERSSLSITYADARRAVRDVNFGKMRYRSEQSRRFSNQLTAWVAAAAVLLLVLAASVRLSFWQESPTPPADAAAPSAAALPADAAPNADIAALPQAPNTPATPEAPDAPDSAPSAAPPDPDLLAAAPAIGAPIVTVAVAPPPPIIRTVTAQPIVRTVIAQPIIQTVVQTVVQVQQVQVPVQVPAPPPAPAPQQNRQALLDAISDFDGGEGFSGEALAAQIAAHAELHGQAAAPAPANAPQSEGGNAAWQQALGEDAPLTDNAQWNWMPASSYLRGRLNATQTWLQQEGASNAYTARLITVSQSRAVFLEKFLRYFSDFYPIRNVMVYPLRLQDGDKFVVTFGVYATRADAKVFIGNVPYFFTGGRPFPQKLSTSLGEAKQAWQS